MTWCATIHKGVSAIKTQWVLTVLLVLAMLLPGASLAQGDVFTVAAPTGGDDWANIMATFALAQAAGPGNTVELQAGTYLISQPVLVENWNGTVRGAGKDVTVLRNGVTPFPRVNLPEDMYGPWSVGGLLMVKYDPGAESELHVQGMTLSPVGLSEPDAWYGMTDIEAIQLYTGLRDTAARVNARFADLRIVGDTTAGHPNGTNLMFALAFLRVWGDMTVSGVDFEHVTLGNAITAWPGGSYTIGGSRPQDRVTMSDIGMAGVFGFGDVGTRIDISNVVARDTAVVYRLQALSGGVVHIHDVDAYNSSLAAILACWPPLGICSAAPNSYLLEHNRVQQMAGGGWAGIEVWEDAVKSQFVISQNRIEGSESGYFGPIMLNGTLGAVVTNNILTGTGAAAIGLGAEGDADSGALLKGNNVQGFDGAAGIWLGANTSSNTVVGGGRDTVLDEGTDNIVTGAGQASGEIGEAVRAAMLLRRDVRDLWK